MILENTDVRISEPSLRDVVKGFPSGGCDQEFLKLTAKDGSFLQTELEVSDEEEIWDEESDDFLPAPTRFQARYHDGRTRKHYTLKEALPRAQVQQLFFDFLASGRVPVRGGRWRETVIERKGRAD